MRPCVGGSFDISYAAYLGLPSSGGAGVDARSNRNPFLVAGSGAGFYNGYKFSLAQYGSFTGKDVAAITHVFVSLGTNDIFQISPLSTALAQLTAGIALMVSEIRAVTPNANICFYSDAVGWKDGINDPGQFYANHHAMMRTEYLAVKALGDSKVAYVPLGLHTDANRFGPVSSAYAVTTNGSPNVTLTYGSLVAGQFVTGSGIPAGTTVLTGANAGGVAVLSSNATATSSAPGIAIRAADAYGLQTVIDDPVNAGYLHLTDACILNAASVLASYVAATTA